MRAVRGVLALAGAFLVVLLGPGCGQATDGRPTVVAGADRERPVLPPIKSVRAVVWAVGDAGADRPETRAVAGMIAARHVDRLLYLGDVYENGTAAEFATGYRPVWGRFREITAPTIGNHEWETRELGYLPFWERVHGAPMPLQYAFRVGRWQVLTLATEDLENTVDVQVAWLQAVLATRPEFGTCRIAFWHRPFESAGREHGDDPRLAPIWEALSGAARIVVTGHDHNMQRLRDRNGITPLISGAGGYSSQPLDEGDPRLRFADDSNEGALRLRIRGRRARLAFVATDGAVLDRHAVRCQRDG